MLYYQYKNSIMSFIIVNYEKSFIIHINLQVQIDAYRWYVIMFVRNNNYLLMLMMIYRCIFQKNFAFKQTILLEAIGLWIINKLYCPINSTRQITLQLYFIVKKDEFDKKKNARNAVSLISSSDNHTSTSNVQCSFNITSHKYYKIAIRWPFNFDCSDYNYP